MPAVLEARSKSFHAAEQRVVIHNISWKTYERLLVEMGESRACRLTYDEGTLEIMSPFIQHEHSNRFLDKLVFVLLEEHGMDFLSAGSLTCKREDIRKGFEPDSCYYVENAGRVRGKSELDLKKDPPPDLAVEVDISHSSMNKFQIYAALKVPEIWLWDGKHLKAFVLQKGGYAPVKESPTFPGMPLFAEFPGFLAVANKQGELAAIREFRKWVRKHMKK